MKTTLLLKNHLDTCETARQEPVWAGTLFWVTYFYLFNSFPNKTFSLLYSSSCRIWRRLTNSTGSGGTSLIDNEAGYLGSSSSNPPILLSNLSSRSTAVAKKQDELLDHLLEEETSNSSDIREWKAITYKHIVFNTLTQSSFWIHPYHIWVSFWRHS